MLAEPFGCEMPQTTLKKVPTKISQWMGIKLQMILCERRWESESRKQILNHGNRCKLATVKRFQDLPFRVLALRQNQAIYSDEALKIDSFYGG